ncbi:hypothetical protein DV711_00830 [Motiliproteus coralliicola]|uniref:Uncharacterized protein n=1 Tax=Motiliproteus coralliicola TaxID=2283196 RepID=A0A369WUE1_9GAMM|nr:hypothetical protein [Motiliproteus coralliicola]RDE24174.1 hypothetical protein DV711_00830 [Motiliproteus coralliicola]
MVYRIQMCVLLVLGLLISYQLQAQNLPLGERTLSLIDNKGRAHPVATLHFERADKDQVRYTLDLDHHRFTDHFLSMKEMKCVQGDELWCFVPYPYSNPHSISATDLRWLEHDLLFLFKRNGEFGANFWNGIYYKLELRNGLLEGEARALDLNLLASPPQDLQRPPIGEFDLEEADLEQRWIPRIRIHP